LLRARAAGIVAVDFLHAGTVLLQRVYVLVLTGHGTRRMHLAAAPLPASTAHGFSGNRSWAA
jgi:hypothetical protein